MRSARGVALMLLLLPLGGMLAGCDSIDTFSLFDSKKKLSSSPTRSIGSLVGSSPRVRRPRS